MAEYIIEDKTNEETAWRNNNGELVRCYNCKYWKSNSAFNESGICNKNRYGDGFSPWDWYCADGEKSIFANLM